MADPVLTLEQLYAPKQPKGLRCAPLLFARRWENAHARWTEFWKRLPGPKDEGILETKYQLLEVDFGKTQAAAGEA